MREEGERGGGGGGGETDLGGGGRGEGVCALSGAMAKTVLRDQSVSVSSLPCASAFPHLEDLSIYIYIHQSAVVSSFRGGGDEKVRVD